MLNSRRSRVVIENLTAYLFIAPAALIIFVFGIFPVAFAFFVSLHEWQRFPESYEGMANYTDALGDLSYVLFFWLALGCIAYGLLLGYRRLQVALERRETHLLVYVVPGIAVGATVAAFLNWFFTLLPFILGVPQRMPRREPRNRERFLEEFNNSFTFPTVLDAHEMMWVGIIVTALVLVVTLYFVRGKNWADYLVLFGAGTLSIIGGVWLMSLTVDAMNVATEAARESGETLPIWNYIIYISAGALLIYAAYWLWSHAVRQDGDRRFLVMAFAALMLAIGGYLLIVEIPQAVTQADDDLMQGFWVTVLYVAGTVPVQLAAGLGLAYLLFHAKRGKTFFRITFFLPYITPFVATAVIFTTFFSNRPDGPANRLVTSLGIAEQKWLLEPTPIFELIFQTDLPQIIEGPGLALVVIMLWSTWTYIGYDTVIFMAGLGNISTEYYEAAQIDGASGWAIFRRITLPLLSPTTFFLSLVAIIGTFQAFTQIWIMRLPAAYDAVDTVGVYLFTTVSTDNNLGYGSAMAFVLFGVILLITLFQNRVLGRRVFYG